MATPGPTCRQAADDLVAVLGTLRARGLTKSPISDETIRRCIVSCQPCRKGTATSRKCLGWRGNFNANTAVVIPFVIDRNELVATVTGEFSFEQRIAPKRMAGWQFAPTAKATYAIELRKVIGDDLCARHHIDLANPDQDGSVWHLQVGGLAAGDQRHRELRWLKVPRWPALPMDMVLVLELAIYNFRNEQWLELRKTNPWRDIVKRSEKIMHTHYFERFKEYYSRQEAGDSWLAFQCNRTSGWSPRPG